MKKKIESPYDVSLSLLGPKRNETVYGNSMLFLNLVFIHNRLYYDLEIK